MRTLLAAVLVTLSVTLTGCTDTSVLKDKINNMTSQAQNMAESAGLLGGETEILEQGVGVLGELAEAAGSGILGTATTILSEGSIQDKIDTISGLADSTLGAITDGIEKLEDIPVRAPLWEGLPPLESLMPEPGKELGKDIEITPPDSLESVVLESVVDGDTLWITDSEGNREKVRLIGIDTPESVHADTSKNTEWGTYASDYTKKLLTYQDTLYLEYDEDETDQYGRTLAYVWLTEETDNLDNMLNYILLEDGYAYAKVYKPNVKYQTVFKKVCDTASEEETGLWSEQGFRELWQQ